MRGEKFNLRKKAFRLFAGLVTLVTVFAAGCFFQPSQKPQTGGVGNGEENAWETPAKIEMLEDFSKNQELFESQLSTERSAAWNLIEGEGIYFHNPSAWNSKIIYKLEKPFVSEFSRERGNVRPHSITITWKVVEPSNSVLTIIGRTLQGNEFYVNLGDSQKCEIAHVGEYYASTFTWVEMDQREPSSGPNVTVTEGTSVLDSLDTIIFRHNKNGATIIKSIEYTENKLTFWEKDDEFVLADFNSSQYEKVLSLSDSKSGTTFDIVDSCLEIVTSPRVNWWEAAVNLRLLKAVPVSEMKEFKFRSQVNFSVSVELVDELGNGMKLSNTDAGVTIGVQDEDGWYEYVVDMPTALAQAFNNSLTSESNIVTVRMASGSSSDTIYFDHFTYTKKS